MLQIPKPLKFPKVMFHPKFMISEMTDFDIVDFPFLNGDVPRRTSYGVYISQLIRFARVCSHVNAFNVKKNVYLPNFSNRVTSIINFKKLKPNFIANKMIWFLFSISD